MYFGGNRLFTSKNCEKMYAKFKIDNMILLILLIQSYTPIYIYIYIHRSWPTLAEGNQKTLYSIATKLRCEEGPYSFSWLLR